MRKTLGGFVIFVLLVVGTAVSAQEEAFEGIDAESLVILAREPVTDSAEVKHILIGWAELAPAYRGSMDARAALRTREQADEVVTQLLAQIRGGDPIEPLMAEFSEDPGSAVTGNSYTATPEAGLVPPFKALSLRLNIGETGLVLTRYGWHIIKRLE